MRHTVLCIFLIVYCAALLAQSAPQQGTIVRMNMMPCDAKQGFMAAMSGGGKVDAAMLCPEYVLVSEKVAYVIRGRSSETLLPLAEVTRFRLQKNEKPIRIEDAAKESHSRIRAMMLRQDRERSQGFDRAQSGERPVEPAAIRDQQ